MKTDRFALAYLVTHPNNIRHPINDSETRVAGAGTQLMLTIMERALQENRKIWGRITSNSLGFYEKFGFEPSKEYSYSDQYHGERSELTPDKIKLYFETHASSKQCA